MAAFRVSKLAVPGASLLITFLAYSSQILFSFIEPAPLSGQELTQFNLLVLCLWICYLRACITSPGRVPQDWSPANAVTEKTDDANAHHEHSRQRWCRKCEAFKPPRAHHCKTCGRLVMNLCNTMITNLLMYPRCIPKMDHHCPWTNNCVSYFTFPHFIRFLYYAVIAMVYLEYFLFLRCAVLWNKRNQPSVSNLTRIYTWSAAKLCQYLGPSTTQLVHLFVLTTVNSLTLFMLGILLVRIAWSLGGNVSTIESWEIERHSRLLRRARVFGGYLDGPNGVKVRIRKQEFPFDIGIWRNITHGMNSGFPLNWLWPFAATPRSSGFEFETNGFEDPSTSWPPPDPDRMPRMRDQHDPNEAFTYPSMPLSNYDEMEAFKMRQRADILRQETHSEIRQRKPFHQRQGSSLDSSLQCDHDDYRSDEDAGSGDSASGEEGWQDSGGNRLKDYGVDEVIEFYDEDDIPISELLRRRKARKV